MLRGVHAATESSLDDLTRDGSGVEWRFGEWCGCVCFVDGRNG